MVMMDDLDELNKDHPFYNEVLSGRVNTMLTSTMEGGKTNFPVEVIQSSRSNK